MIPSVISLKTCITKKEPFLQTNLLGKLIEERVFGYYPLLIFV